MRNRTVRESSSDRCFATENNKWAELAMAIFKVLRCFDDREELWAENSRHNKQRREKTCEKR